MRAIRKQIDPKEKHLWPYSKSCKAKRRFKMK